MGAKLKSETHLQNMFFYFFEAVFARLTSEFSKSSNMTKKLLEKNQKRYQKTQNFTLILKALKKLLKNAPKKL